MGGAFLRFAALSATSLIAVSIPSTAQAQETPTKTWWNCWVEVPISNGVKLRMTLLGPAASRSGKSNMYIARFERDETPASIAANKEAFAAALMAYATQAGLRIASGTEHPAQASCAAKKSAQEASAHAAWLIEPNIAGNMTYTYEPTYLDWRPVAAIVKPVPAVTVRISSNRLGVTPQEVTEHTAELLGLVPARGVVIKSVRPGSAAAAAGLKNLDVIVEASGQPVSSIDDLRRIWGGLRLGYKAPVRIWRASSFVEVPVEVREVAPRSAGPVTTPPVMSAAVKNAVEKALLVERSARAKAEAARAMAASARAIMEPARTAAAQAEQKLPGYRVLKKSLFSYAGQVVGENRFGLGVTTYLDGNIYMGQNASVADGLGVFIYTVGNRYEGEHRADALAGLGVYQWRSGARLEGEWANNAAVEGVFTFAPGATTAEKIGMFTGTAIVGLGVIVFKNGERAEGQFSPAGLHGPGVVRNADGTIKEAGIFDNAKLTTPGEPQSDEI